MLICEGAQLGTARRWSEGAVGAVTLGPDAVRS